MEPQLSLEENRLLNELLQQRYSIEELKTLCFNIGFAYDSVDHSTRPVFARELLLAAGRKGFARQLIREIIRESSDPWLLPIASKFMGEDTIGLQVWFPKELKDTLR